jgi:hypothetical protein
MKEGRQVAISASLGSGRGGGGCVSRVVRVDLHTHCYNGTCVREECAVHCSAMLSVVQAGIALNTSLTRWVGVGCFQSPC